MLSRFVIGLVCAALAAGQQFEVASVKPADPSRHLREIHGGPGSSDPGAVNFNFVDLSTLVGMAYGIDSYQVVGPDWLGSIRFDIAAKLPAGATREQYRKMLQNLLAERFRLTAHQEQRESQTFDLVVAKNGPKLTEYKPDPSAAVDDSVQPPPSAPHPPPGYRGPLSMSGRYPDLDRFAGFLAAFLGKPVHNATGLKGAYDIRITCSMGGPRTEGGDTPDIYEALQEQLGLRLVAKKGTMDVLVIDRIEKVPTPN